MRAAGPLLRDDQNAPKSSLLVNTDVAERREMEAHRMEKVGTLAGSRIDPNVSIIAACGLNGNGNVAKANDAGAKNFLAKPYSTERLLILIRKVTRSRGIWSANHAFSPSRNRIFRSRAR